MPESYRTFPDAMMDAVENDDHTVELVPGDPYGWHFEIDGVRILEGEEGLPWEVFELGGDFWEYLTDEGEDLIRSLDGGGDELYGPADVPCPYCGETIHVEAGPTRRCEVKHCGKWLVVDLVEGQSGVSSA